jgi:hypothetical protein
MRVLIDTENSSINGNIFPVVLDSGRYKKYYCYSRLANEMDYSSDLWVQSEQEIPNAQITHSNVEINYVMGSLSGDVESGKVELGGMVVTDQRYRETSTL